MQMHRQPTLSNVLKDRQELRRIERRIGDIRKDLKSTEPELPGAAVDFCNRSLKISKANGAEPDELPRVVSNDPCQVVVEAHGPLICLLAAKHVRSEWKAMAQHCEIDLHVFHLAKLFSMSMIFGNAGISSPAAHWTT